MSMRNTGRTKPAQKAPSAGMKRLAAFGARLRYILAIGIPVMGIAGLIYLLSHAASTAFAVRTVALTGNEHLSDEELKHISGLKGNENLISLSGNRIYAKLKESPWIQTAVIRKEYPSTLMIRIRETEPFALLDMKGKMFIVDDQGRMLEELKENSVPFLPIILSDPYNEKDAFREAVSLAKAIRTVGLLHKNERIEIIAHKPNEVAANLDGVFVKVGAGEHEEKLARLMETTEEIKKKNVSVAYIDLRFARKVVVKPVHEVIK